MGKKKSGNYPALKGTEDKGVLDKPWFRLPNWIKMLIKIIIILIKNPIIATILVFFLCLGILYAIDRNALWLRENISHHIDGSVWFAAIASLFSVISSVLMGLFAMRQTERLNELQEHFRRPTLVVENSELTMDFVNRKAYANGKRAQSYPLRIKRIINNCRELENDINYAWMQLRLKLILCNDIGVNSICIEKMTFKIGNERYTFTNRYEEDSGKWTAQNEQLKLCRGFKYTFRATNEEYDIQEGLFHLAPDNANVWQSLGFVCQIGTINPKYETIDAEIVARLDFVTEIERSEWITINMIFNNPERIDNAIYRISAESGRIVYIEKH